MSTTDNLLDGSSFTRKETKSYPGAALREVILNAFCHADYFIRSDIKIEFFADHAKIVNPGGVFNATIEDVMNGVQTYRNPKLVHIFDKLGLIENFGTGIPRTIDAYQGSDLNPTFESSDKYFKGYPISLRIETKTANNNVSMKEKAYRAMQITIDFQLRRGLSRCDRCFRRSAYARKSYRRNRESEQ